MSGNYETKGEPIFLGGAGMGGTTAPHSCKTPGGKNPLKLAMTLRGAGKGAIWACECGLRWKLLDLDPGYYRWYCMGGKK